MLLKLFYDTKLAQASYLVGCQRTGEAMVIDPNRHVGQYLDAARAEGLRIAHVTETHIHADFVSGARELARAARATLYLSREGGPDWQYAFARTDGATLVGDHDRIKVGNVIVEVLHTPGHTPEHLSFLLTDGAATDRPMGVFTGDFIFVGDVGRPDLLERAAGHAGTMEAGARTLFASLQRFKALPDYLQLWPGHGAGSACGKALGAVPSSTLGYERFANWGLSTAHEDDFVQLVLAGQPEPPAYFARMKQVNRDGPELLGERPAPPRLEAARLAEVLRSGATVVDLRGTRDFAAGHVAGTINVPASRSLLTYAGAVLRAGRPLYLLGDDTRVAEAWRDVALIGFDRIEGAFGLDALAAGARGSVPQRSPAELSAALADGAVTLVDVRGLAEVEAFRIAGSRHIPLGAVPDRMGEIPADRPVVLQCESGSRSAIAASLLAAAGRRDVMNLSGGISAWLKAGLPVEREAPASVS